MLKLFFEDGLFPNFHDFFSNHVKHIKVFRIDECDYVVSFQLMFGVYDQKEVQKGLNVYKNYTKRVILFLVSDSSKTFNVPENVLLFRTSVLKSKQKGNEFVLPYIFEQPLNFISLEKTKIGFCEQTQHNIGKRKSTIKAFLKSNIFITNFIERNSFWNGKPNDENLKKEFENNIYDNHFNICNKGRGNFSIRFYQVLSAGRIPVVLDTNVKLPFDEEIDYKNHIIISKSNKRLVQKTKDFYESKTSEELLEIQEKNRQLYQEYFSFGGFGEKLEKFLGKYSFVKKRRIWLF